MFTHCYLRKISHYQVVNSNTVMEFITDSRHSVLSMFERRRINPQLIVLALP